MLTMQMQAEAINSVYAAHNVACKVVPPPHSFQASTYSVFRLQRAAGVPVSKVTGRAAELGEALGQMPRFDEMPLSLEVQRPDPQRLALVDLWPMLTRQTVPGLPMVTGQGVDAGRLRPMLLNMAHPNTPQLLVAGTTGSGKTSLLFSLVLSAAIMQSPRQLAIVALDPKAVDFRTLYGLPHLAGPVVTDPLECVAALRAVVTELERRKEAGMKDPEQRILVVIDELAELMAVAGNEVEALVQRINSVGRGLGVHIIGATQKPLAELVGSIVKSNFPVRAVGRVTSGDDAKVATGLRGTGAESLPGMGSFLVVNGTTHRVQAYHAADGEHGQIIGQIARRWDNAAPHFALLLEAQTKEYVQRLAGEIETTPSAEIPVWLVPAIRGYIKKHGKAPSQRKTQEQIQKREGKMLPWPLVKAAITQAQRNGDTG